MTNSSSDLHGLSGASDNPANSTAFDDEATPGTRIGPYKLLRRLGEGGMGTVWEAEQTEPVRRRVAVKLIKASMDFKQVLARFEAERQALALMDHPNIAKVLDARDRNRVVKAWDLKTGKETADAGAAEWLKNAIADSRSPDGQCFAIGHVEGAILLTKPLPPDEFELGYREAMARPDADWHWQQAQKYAEENAWFAAKFHCEQVLKTRPDLVDAKALLETAGNEREAQ